MSQNKPNFPVIINSEHLQKPAYGSNLYNYIYKQISEKFVGEINNNNLADKIKKQIQMQLRCFGCRLDHPSINVQMDPADPNKMNINVNLNIPWANAEEYEVMDPENDITHSWGPVVNKPGVFKCSRCHLLKLEMHQTGIGSYQDVDIILAKQNLSCNERMIKDIIE